MKKEAAELAKLVEQERPELMVHAIASAKMDGNIVMQKTVAPQNVQHPKYLPMTVAHAFVQKMFVLQTADLMQTVCANLKQNAMK